MTRIHSQPRSRLAQGRRSIVVEPNVPSRERPALLRAEWSVGASALMRARPDLWPKDARLTERVRLAIEIEHASDSATARASLIIAGRDPIELTNAAAHVFAVPGGWHADADGVISALFKDDGTVRYAQTPILATLALPGGRYELANKSP